MKKRLIKITTWLICKLQKIYFKLTYKEVGEVGYSSLSPIDNYSIEDNRMQIEEVTNDNRIINNDDYLKALLWALKNRKKENIKNIALTGPYGSGKSSILRTFQKHYKGEDLKFLEISLATFKEENPKIDENGSKIKPDKDQLLRLIETSILEQIFYHEEDDKVPDSRFKKIKSYSKKQLLGNAASLLVFIIAILNYFFPYLIQSIFKDHPFSENICNWLHYSGIIVIILGVFFIIYKSIRLINSVTLNKLNIQNAEIGFGDNNSNKSILNHHIDEILYFFSVRPYNVVIIEDLDRFRETEIFTKLREVNLLLNSSERTQRKDIVFIYAVRDEMFNDKERAKFFDFIIPIIPIINSSNSGEILRSKKIKYKYEISDRFIEDISFYIDDMRLLNNICNEFYLYKQKLSKSLSQDKLFAIITYKNIYPNDFVQLSCNDGSLYNTLHSKRNYINQEVDKIDKQINECKVEILSLENLFIKSISDLRKLYILLLIQKLNRYKTFIVNEVETTVDELSQDENFAYFIKNKLKYQLWNYYNYSGWQLANSDISISFSEIERKFDPNQTYLQKENEIKEYNQGKINLLKNKIKESEKKKLKTRNLKIEELLKSNWAIELNISEDLNKNFIYTLLKNGYVSEDYIDYISLFHEGSITRTDHQYIISVRNGTKLEANYILNKLDKLVGKLNPLDFETEYTLNYNLVDFLLYNSFAYTNQLQAVFNKLKDESSASIEFINGFIETSENLEVFVKTLCTHWINIWAYINHESIYTDEDKLKYLKLIFEYAEISSIKEIAKQSNLEQIILGKKNFLSIIQNENKLKGVIQELGILFVDIDFHNSPDSLLQFIYENNYYSIDKLIIKPIIKSFGKFDQVAFDHSNYSSILKSECPYLISYIEDNMELYIENIYLDIEININEEEDSYIKLLDNEEISFDNRIHLIQKINTKITELHKVDNKELYSVLFSENKIIPTWDNILLYYTYKQDLTEFIISFLNNLDNANELSKTKIKVEKNDIKYSEFCQKVIICNKIATQNYNLILNSIPWRYDDLELDNLSEDQVVSLINKLLINPTKKAYELIKAFSESLVIILIEKYKADYLKIIDQIEWDSNDLNFILKSNTIKNSEKKTFLDNCADATITNNKENLDLINQIMLDDLNFTVNNDLIKMIILERRNPIINRIRLFNKYCPLITSFDDLIDSLSGDYLEIFDKRKRAKLNDTQYNRCFLDILISKNYIASYSEKKDILRVYHSTKND